MITPTRSRRSLRRLIAGAVALMLFAGACGDDGSSSFTADALGGGSGPETFCAAFVGAIGSGQTDSVPTKDELETTIGLLNNAGNALPGEAPEGIGVFIETLITVAEASIALIDGDGSSDPFGDSSAAMEGVERLEELDFEAMGLWTQEYCEGQPGYDTEVLDGLTSDGGTASSGIDGDFSDAIAMDDDMTDQIPTTTTIPVETVTLSDGGDPANYRATALEVESVIATNAHPEDYREDESPEEGVNYLSVTIYAETDDYSIFFSADDFVLTGPDGRPTAGNVLTDTRGAVSGSASLDSRDSETFVVSFTTDELITDLDGWVLMLDREGRVPETISMGEPVATLYPVALDAASTGTIAVASALGSCDIEEFSVAFDEIQISIEAPVRDDIFRIDAGERFVEMFLDVTSTATPTGSSCDATAAIFDYDFRLEADGRPLASSQPAGPFTYMQPGESRLQKLLFSIPADTTSLSLMGEQGEALGTWEISLPAVPGE